MPMSCSTHAAHSSSRSTRVAGVQAGGGELVEQPEREPRDVLGVRVVDVVQAGEVQHRLAAHVVEERLGRSSQCEKKTPSRSPASVTSTPSNSPTSRTVRIDGARRRG